LKSLTEYHREWKRKKRLEPGFLKYENKVQKKAYRKRMKDPIRKMKHNKSTAEYVAKQRLLTKQKAVELKGGKCSACGYSKNLNALDFHHVDPTQKEFAIYSCIVWEKVEKELQKCVLLCANCHREIHSRKY
jgi:hypothetical protein